jgi:16S rRNA (adenine1518-N6/adenine1519-N6)-dimethyltransferase
MTNVEPRPVKRLGQNWLRDPKVIEKMLSAAELKPLDTVVEIGPGTGAITKPLAKLVERVVAYEIDPNLVKTLKEELHYAANVEVIEQNILAQRLTLPEHNYKVVASLPYYITSPVLEKILCSKPSATLVVLLVQKEVAEKIVARPPDSSYLANFVRLFGEPEIVGQVSSGSFYPRPQVESAILRIRSHPIPAVPPEEIEQVMALLHGGFTEPRKQLHNSLSAGLKLSVRLAKKFLKQAEIDSNRRAETLTLPEWLKLYEVIKKA